MHFRLILILIATIGASAVFAKDTELKFYRPFIDGMQLRINKKLQGQCWLQSQLIKREDAWRCVVNTEVYDPCFIKPNSDKEVICPYSPWSAEAIQINLPSSLNNSQHIALDMSEAYPWAVELMNGEQCMAVDEGQVFDNLQVHYRCNSQTILIGRVQRCKSQWSILQRTAKGISTALLAKAWF